MCLVSENRWKTLIKIDGKHISKSLYRQINEIFKNNSLPYLYGNDSFECIKHLEKQS